MKPPALPPNWQLSLRRRTRAESRRYGWRVPASWLAVDLEQRVLSFRFHDDRRVDIPMPGDMFPEPMHLRRVELDVAASIARVSLPSGAATIELWRPGLSLAKLRAGRPVLYLDQNHWSTMAAVRHGHRPVREGERDAALQIAAMVEAGELLLPVSAAHLVETTPMYGVPRVALADTVLALGRGWQMRNPLHVRVEELVRAVSGSEPAAADVFAPGADQFFAGRPASRGGRSAVGSDGPAAELKELMDAMPAMLGIYEAVIDPEPIIDEGGLAEKAAGAWAQALAALAAQLRQAGESAETVRRVAGARLLTDMADDIVRAALAADTTPEAVIDCLTSADDPVGQMPFLSQMRQMLFARLRNSHERWEANDLIDIMFLCCAAGYSEVVAGERRAVGYLRQARYPPPRANLAITLREAADILTGT